MNPINYNTFYWQNDLVRLRAMQPEDWEEHYLNSFDSQARRRLQYEIELPSTIFKEKAKAEKYANFNPESGLLMFAIETLDGKNVGGLNLSCIDEKNGTFSIGMQINRDERGKGYGTSAMRILLGYAFFERRLHKYFGSVLEDNVASMTMLKKLGCVQEGVRRQQIYTGGRYWDEVLFGLTSDEFSANEAKFKKDT